MNMKEKKRDLALSRLQQASESLDEAHYLFTGGKSSRSVINRAYYAMFYSILALLVFEEYSSSKHSGVLSYFNARFIKDGLFPKDLGEAFFYLHLVGFCQAANFSEDKSIIECK